MTGAREETILALETSGLLAGVAVESGGRLLAEAAADSRVTPTEMLLAMAQRVLNDLNITPHDCDRIAFSEGPGSFTGLRVGMAAALGLAAGTGRPLVAVPSLEVLAYPWREAGEPVAVVSGHRRGRAHSALLRWDGERFESILPAASRPEDELFRDLETVAGGRFLFVGDGLDSLAGAIRSRLGSRAVLLSTEPARAAHLARLAGDPARPLWVGRDLEGRTPMYLRDADARKPRQRN